MITMPHLEGIFAPPSIIFTLKDNLKSVTVIKALLGLNCQAKCIIFDSENEAKDYFKISSISPNETWLYLTAQ